MLGLGADTDLYVRSPAVYAAPQGCAPGCPLWSLRLRMPVGEVWNFVADGPASSLQVVATSPGAVPPDACGEVYGGLCATGESPLDPGAEEVYLLLGVLGPSNGAVFHVHVYSGTGLTPSCAGGCNGDGEP